VPETPTRRNSRQPVRRLTTEQITDKCRTRLCRLSQNWAIENRYLVVHGVDNTENDPRQPARSSNRPDPINPDLLRQYSPIDHRRTGSRVYLDTQTNGRYSLKFKLKTTVTVQHSFGGAGNSGLRRNDKGAGDSGRCELTCYFGIGLGPGRVRCFRGFLKYNAF
jgi:hypothetical protein